MKSLFSTYAELMGKKIPSPKGLTMEEKVSLVHHLNMRGESMTAIAKWLGVSRQQAYNYRNKAKDDRLMELENCTFLDNTVKELYDLEHTRDMYRKQRDRILMIQKGIDPETGEKNENPTEGYKSAQQREYTEISRLIFQYDKLILDFQHKVGTLPNVETQLYHKVKDQNPESDNSSSTLMEKNPQELQAIMLAQLANKRPSLRGSLKELKNESVI